MLNALTNHYELLYNINSFLDNISSGEDSKNVVEYLTFY